MYSDLNNRKLKWCGGQVWTWRMPWSRRAVRSTTTCVSCRGSSRSSGHCPATPPSLNSTCCWWPYCSDSQSGTYPPRCRYTPPLPTPLGHSLTFLLTHLLLGQPVRDVPTKMQVHPSPPDAVGTLADVSLNSFTARTAGQGRTHQDAGTPLPSRRRWGISWRFP